MVLIFSDKLICLSTLRRARAEAVLQVLPSRRSILNLPELASETELTVSQIETALNDLASAGLIEIVAERGCVRVSRIAAESEAA